MGVKIALSKFYHYEAEKKSHLFALLPSILSFSEISHTHNAW